SCGFVAGAGDGEDRNVQPGIGERGDVPWTGDYVGRFAVEEGFLGHIVGDGGVQYAGAGLSDGGQIVGERLAVLPAHSEFGHIGAAVVHLEDLSAEGGLERVHVVRVALFTHL